MSRHELVLDEIKRDITTFADPGTAVEISSSGALNWIQLRKEMSAQLIRSSTDFPTVQYGNREYSYRSFLASENLANLLELAHAIAAQTTSPRHYVPMQVRPSMSASDGEAEAMDAVDLLEKEAVDISRRPLTATRVLFVYGNAGVGKTSTLRAMTSLQAERFLTGEAKTIFLYLDAQGKGLNQLEDVMARSLQDLRARFTYHSVAALARRNCIVPIVDGFDELIGPSTAREAFSNLALFLAQLDREGALITASRSSFFDYRTLFERAAEIAATRGLSYEVAPFEILHWSDEKALRYCEKREPGNINLREQIEQLLSNPSTQSIVRKPFYLNQVCDTILDNGNIDESNDLSRQVITAALDRETTKLKNSRGESLFDSSAHRGFCEDLAEEMWYQGRPDLDLETIRLLADLFADNHNLNTKDRKILVDRSIAHGLLVPIPGQERRAFEHELFRFEFQASGLATALSASTAELRDYVCRAEIPLELVDRLPLVHSWLPPDITQATIRLQRVRASTRKNEFVASNAGSIAAALLRDRKDIEPNINLQELFFRTHSFGEVVLQSADLKGAIFERVDLSGARFYDCETEGTLFLNCLVSAQTEFRGTSLDPNGWPGLNDRSSREEFYDPVEIMNILALRGAKVPDVAGVGTDSSTQKGTSLAKRAVRFLEKARQQYYFSRKDTWVKGNLSDDLWDELEDIFRKYKLIEDSKITKSGPAEIFFKLTMPPDLVLQARTDPEQNRTAGDFWKEITTTM